MPFLRLRYRHDVKCKDPACDLLVAAEGHTSDVIFPDGAPVKLEAGDRDFEWRCAFVLQCKAGHDVDLYAPRDVKVLKSSAAGEADSQPIVLRSGMG